MLLSPRKQTVSIDITTLQSPTKSSALKYSSHKVNDPVVAIRKTACAVGHSNVIWPEKLPKKEYMEHRLSLIEKKKEMLLQQLEDMEKKKDEIKRKKFIEKLKIEKRSKSLQHPSFQKQEEAKLAAIIRDKDEEVKYLESKILEEKFAAALKSNNLNKSTSSRAGSVSGRSVSGKSVGSEKSFVSDFSNGKPRYSSLTISKSMPSVHLVPNHFEKHLRKSSYRLPSNRPFNPSGNKNGREYHRSRPHTPQFQSPKNETSGMLSPHHVAAGTTIEPLKVSFRRGGVSATKSRSAVPQEAMRAIANAQDSFISRQKRAFDLDRQRRIKLALTSVGRLSTRTSITTQSSQFSTSDSTKQKTKKLAKSSTKKKSVRKGGPVKIPGETLTRRRDSIEEIKRPKKKKIVTNKKKLTKKKVSSNIISDDEVNGDADTDTEERIQSATANILAVLENAVNHKVSSKKKKIVKKKKVVRV